MGLHGGSQQQNNLGSQLQNNLGVSAAEESGDLSSRIICDWGVSAKEESGDLSSRRIYDWGSQLQKNLGSQQQQNGLRCMCRASNLAPCFETWGRVTAMVNFSGKTNRPTSTHGLE